MWLKLKNIVLTHLVQSAVIAVVAIVVIVVTSYLTLQKDNSSDLSDNTKESTSDNSTNSCTNLVNIDKISVEKDPAGDPEAWLRFDYTTTASREINCQYTITFYDNQEQIIRTISDVEDTFQSPSGQIYNGYSSTPYQAGMAAKVTVQ